MKSSMRGAVAALSLTTALMIWANPCTAEAKHQAPALSKVESACLQVNPGSGGCKLAPQDWGNLLSLATSANVQVRCLAIYALGEVEDVRAVGVLTANLGDENIHVRRIAARALGKVGGQQAAAPLIKVLGNGQEDLGVRCVAAEALGMIGGVGCSQALLRAAKEETGRLRDKATTALGKVPGAPASRAGLLSAN